MKDNYLETPQGEKQQDNKESLPQYDNVGSNSENDIQGLEGCSKIFGLLIGLILLGGGMYLFLKVL